MHEVQLDDNTGSYGAAHWTDNSTPPDGDADDPGERKYPVCFVRDTTMEASVEVELSAEWQPYGDVYLRGDGPGGLDFYTEDVSVNGTVATAGPIECSAAFPNMVNRYAPMPIAWEASVDGGQSWHYVGTSVNECFVTLATPQCSPRFRTVLYLATKQTGATAEAQCVANTWASFSSGSGPANVKAWDETAGDYATDLVYWLEAASDSYTDTTALLAHQHGNCHAFAHLLHQALRANDVADAEKTTLYYVNWVYNRFWVQNVEATHQTYAEPWLYATGDLDDSADGIPGQNNAHPYLKRFNRHFILYWDGTWFDPSYGRTATTEQGYTNDSIGFVEDAINFTPSRWREPHVDNYPDVSLTLTQSAW